MSEHTHTIVGPKVYVTILFALLMGTGLTVWASFVDLGVWNPVVALAIATTKATLVVLYFMQVKYSTRLNQTCHCLRHLSISYPDQHDSGRLRQQSVG